jgi:chemotaxis protein methyltransferase CheR
MGGGVTPGWTSPAMAEVAELVRATTGLTFPAARVADVEATIRRTMARRGLTDVGRLVGLLRSDQVEREAMVAELTIGETYFQRDPAQFGLLADEVLPELLQRRPHDRPVRVWSAGCASGEEPYTIAMLFDELGALDRAQIIGTDIARSRLEDAQRGIYSQWSLRASSPETRARYFRERGRFYEFRPSLRERVDFRYLNLAEDKFPSLSIGIWGMDVILCRNVLIYFDAATVERVARRLIASLSEDGWLILGASDPAISEMVECDVVLTAAGLVYRRPGASGDPAALRGGPARDNATASAALRPPPGKRAAPLQDDAVAVEAVLRPLHEDAPEGAAGPGAPQGPAAEPAAAEAADDVDAAIVAAYRGRNFDRVRSLAESLPPEQLGEAAWTSWLRALANQGCLEDAGEVAQRAIQVQGPTAELLYLHAVLLLQAGRAADAAAALRRALYLDRDFVVAHLTLADAQQRTADPAGARRSLRNAAALLSALPAETEVPASDGETAGRMAELVRVKLRLLDEAA